MLDEFIYILKEAVLNPLQSFVNSSKRIYVVYLVISLAIAFYVYKKQKIKGSFFKYVFNKKVWFGSSARIDYGLFFFNGFVKILLIAPFLYFGFVLAFNTHEFLVGKFGYVEKPLSKTTTLIVYTIVLTIFNDFLVYITHLAMHKIPFMWEFHKIHHSATTMNPITQYRLHPIELIINNIQAIIGFGLVTGFFQYLSEGVVSKWMFLGANVFSFVFFVLGANLRHSHVRFRYFYFLEFLFMSPLQHQIHHSKSREHWDKNMGSKLAIWDWLFGTLKTSKNVKKINFGLGAGQDIDYRSFWKNLSNPFVNNFNRIRDWFKK